MRRKAADSGLRCANKSWVTAVLLTAAATAGASLTPAAPAVAASTAPPAAGGAPTEGSTVLPTVDVTANRVAEPLSDSTSAITVITHDQIVQKEAFDLTDLVDLAPDVSLAQSGTRGKVASVFIRGANSNQSLVLIDGMPVDSPSSGEFDFGPIPVENIERIEVLRGPQSTLYGSEAMGGVINIITRRGSGPLKTSGQVEYGDFNTNRQTGSAFGMVGKNALSLAITNLQTSGYSVNDDFETVGGSLRLDHPVGKGAALSLIGRVDDGESGAPGQRFLAFDPNERNPYRNLFGSIQYARTGGRTEDRVALGLFDRLLRDINPADAINSSTANDRFYDQVLSMEAQRSIHLGRNLLTGGAEGRHERASTTFHDTSSFGPFDALFGHAIDTAAVFLQDETRFGSFDVVPGARYEHNSQFGDTLNGRVASAYHLTRQLRVKGSVGTGFRAPTVDELYFPGSGNPALQPEKSTGYDLGLEQDWRGGGRLELMALRNEFRDLVSGFPPKNLNHARTEGVELGFRRSFGRGLTAVVNHDFLHTTSSSGPLLRRPRFNTTADLLYARRRVHADLGLLAQGDRLDNDFVTDPAAGRNYPGFVRNDLTLGYDVRRDWQVYARAQNLFNQKYQEVAGYPAPLFNFVVGFRAGAF